MVTSRASVCFYFAATVVAVYVTAFMLRAGSEWATIPASLAACFYVDAWRWRGR